VRLLGGAAGAGLLPLNFACGSTGGAIVIGSHFEPTPGEPLTPNDDFYVNSNFGMPELPAPTRWRLHVQGLVDRELALSLDELTAMGTVTREITLECIGNSPGGNLVSSAAFEGVPLSTVMESAGLSSRARGLQFLGLDGYPSYLPVDVARDEEGLVVVAMNGELLPPAHGAPARVLFPGRYGMFSIKWLDSITAARTWHTYGALGGLTRAVEGGTRVRSRIDGPPDGRTVDPGEPVEITGLAVTPGTGVARVEVAIDGTWRPAEITFNRLDDGRSPLLWTLWRFTWTPTEPGRHVLRVRAFDERGAGQDEDPDFPYDGSAIHSVRVLVRG